MFKGNCVVLAAALAFALTGCASNDTDGGETHVATNAVDTAALQVDPEVARMRALAAEARAIVDETVWSGRFADNGSVTRAWMSGSLILFELRDVNTREYEIHCVDAASGKQRWIVILGDNPLDRAPHVGDGTIAFLTANDGGMVVVDSARGSRLWHVRARMGVVPAGDAIGNDGTVYCSSHLSGRMAALVAADGRKAWDFNPNGVCRTAPVLTTPAGRELLVFGTDAGELVALEAKQWDEVAPTAATWTKQLNGPVSGDPTFAMVGEADAAMGLVVVPCEDGWLYGVDPTTGRSRWVVRTDKGFKRSAAVIGNRVFARNANRMFCVDAVTGQRLWYGGDVSELSAYERDEVFREVQGFEHAERALAADAERVYLMQGDNRIMRCKSEDGTVENEQAMPAFDFFLTNEATGALIMGTRDGYFMACK